MKSPPSGPLNLRTEDNPAFGRTIRIGSFRSSNRCKEAPTRPSEAMERASNESLSICSPMIRPAATANDNASHTMLKLARNMLFPGDVLLQKPTKSKPLSA
jgi:hypothetical protein